VFLIQQIFTCKQYGAHRPDSQQPNPSDDLSIDEHWPWGWPRSVGLVGLVEYKDSMYKKMVTHQPSQH